MNDHEIFVHDHEKFDEASMTAFSLNHFVPKPDNFVFADFLLFCEAEVENLENLTGGDTDSGSVATERREV